jgi:hypothetical protein
MIIVLYSFSHSVLFFSSFTSIEFYHTVAKKYMTLLLLQIIDLRVVNYEPKKRSWTYKYMQQVNKWVPSAPVGTAPVRDGCIGWWEATYQARRGYILLCMDSTRVTNIAKIYCSPPLAPLARKHQCRNQDYVVDKVFFVQTALGRPLNPVRLLPT